MVLNPFLLTIYLRILLNSYMYALTNVFTKISSLLLILKNRCFFHHNETKDQTTNAIIFVYKKMITVNIDQKKKHLSVNSINEVRKMFRLKWLLNFNQVKLINHPLSSISESSIFGV